MVKTCWFYRNLVNQGVLYILHLILTNSLPTSLYPENLVMEALLDEVKCIESTSREKVWGAWLMGVNLQLSQHLKVITSPVQVAAYGVAQFGVILMPISMQS